MTAFTLVRSLHVITAVATGGLFGAIPLTAAYARRSTASVDSLLDALVRYTRIGLVVLFISAIVLDRLVHGVLHEMTWFRASGLLTIVLGASLARTRIVARRAATDAPRWRAVQWWGAWMCALVALLAFLMSAKPS